MMVTRRGSAEHAHLGVELHEGFFLVVVPELLRGLGLFGEVGFLALFYKFGMVLSENNQRRNSFF